VSDRLGRGRGSLAVFFGLISFAERDASTAFEGLPRLGFGSLGIWI
jgi:hypothetical protein